MVRHFAGLAEIVEDVETAVHFYRDVIGATVHHKPGESYATIDLPGILHYGIWSRQAAALSLYGSADEADNVPLGIILSFEVDSVEQESQRLEGDGITLLQKPQKEQWGQITARLLTTSRTLVELVETPNARIITQQIKTEGAEG